MGGEEMPNPGEEGGENGAAPGEENAPPEEEKEPTEEGFLRKGDNRPLIIENRISYDIGEILDNLDNLMKHKIDDDTDEEQS